MGAKERKSSIAEARKIITTMQGRDVSDVTVEDVGNFAKDLAVFVQEIMDDFEETRENMSENEGLLATWEENTGYQFDEWLSIFPELESFDIEGVEDSAEGIENAIDEIIQYWEQGPQ